MAAHHKTTQDEILLDIKVGEFSALHRFYLNHQKKFLGTLSVFVFLFLWKFVGGSLSVYDPIPALRFNPLFISAPSIAFMITAAGATFQTDRFLLAS